jgi:hypothetical protein
MLVQDFFAEKCRTLFRGGQHLSTCQTAIALGKAHRFEPAFGPGGPPLKEFLSRFRRRHLHWLSVSFPL